MIVVTRLDGARFALNDDHIERIDQTPTTLVRLVNGNSYPVLETLDEVVDRIAAFRARAHPHLVGEVRTASVRPLRPLELIDREDGETDGCR